MRKHLSFADDSLNIATSKQIRKAILKITMQRDVNEVTKLQIFKDELKIHFFISLSFYLP